MMIFRFVFLGCIIAMLAACGASGSEEISVWMDEQRRTAMPKVKPLAEPQRFIPQAYTQRGSIDPFDPEKLTRALQLDAKTSGNAQLVLPHLTRRKEPLEAYPLDAMTMVGSLEKLKKPVALVRVEKLLYQVMVGDHMGQNYGRITKITETEVILLEIVQDANGDWVERSATLHLQEKEK